MKFRILSIDGGGLRGLIPLIMIETILKETQNKTISNCFDLIAGTSTGGIIACALSIKDTSGNHVYSVDDLKRLYIEHGSRIFDKSKKSIFPWFRPKYGTSGLYSVLEEYFKKYKLSDCKTPLLISAYELDSFKPFFYVSRSVNPTSYYEEEKINYYLSDICKSTSAAPTYFKPHYFVDFDPASNSQKNHHHIDGGIYINNPSLSALLEILSHPKDPLYIGAGDGEIKLEDIYLLSLGTGMSSKSIDRKKVSRWGQINWGINLFDIMMQGSSQAVDNQVKSILSDDNYLRLDILLNRELSAMDDSSESTRKEITDILFEKIINNEVAKKDIHNFLRKSGII